MEGNGGLEACGLDVMPKLVGSLQWSRLGDPAGRLFHCNGSSIGFVPTSACGGA